MNARLVLSTCLLALAALPASAEGASISYIGSDGNAYLTTPDGSRTVQLTKDGTPTSKYKMAGQADNGEIVVHREKYFSWLNPDGTTASGPWRLAEPSGSGIVLNAHVQPGGTVVAVDWNTGAVSGGWKTIKMPRGIHTNACFLGCFDNVVRPRWVPGADLGFISDNLRVVSVIVPGMGAPQDWFTVENHITSSFDVSRAGGKILIEAFPDTGTSPPKSLAVLQSTGLPPNTPTLVCELANFSAAGGFPRWSPDGGMIVWEDPAGVMVSPAPVNQNGTCVLSPRLIAAGGRTPDWGLKDVPMANTPPCTDCVRPPEQFDVGLKPGGRLPKLGVALARGLTFAVATERPGRVVVELEASGKLARGALTKVVARGSRTATAAGTVKVKVRFTKRAKRRYRALRKLKLTARVTVADSAGTVAKASRKLVLRR